MSDWTALDDNGCMCRGAEGRPIDPIKLAYPARLPETRPSMIGATQELAARIDKAAKEATGFGVQPREVRVVLDAITYDHIVCRLDSSLWPHGAKPGAGRIVPVTFWMGGVTFVRGTK